MSSNLNQKKNDLNFKEKILITTSGLGSRLGSLTLYTNKSLIKLGDKAIISHIIDSYPYQDFVITLGHYGDMVKQYLEIAHPDRNFDFVNVNPYAGLGSGLLTSMLFAKDYLQCPFIFHACDTIIDGWHPGKITFNYMVCAESSDSDLLRTVCINDGLISRINDKGEINYDLAYIGVAGIYDYQLFWDKLESIKKHILTDSSDCHVLSEMLSYKDINVWKVDKWFDTGCVHNLNKVKKQFPQSFDVLDKSMESIYFLSGSVIKYFHNSSICNNRVERVKYLNGMVPKLLGHSKNFYKYTNSDGELLADVITENKIMELINYGDRYLWKPIKMDQDDFKRICYIFYHDKTENRINEFKRINNIIDKSEKINDIIVPDMEFMLKNIDWNWICNSTPTGFHGDFILDNILYNGIEKFTLLDWREDFGGLLDAGDKYYDLSKFNHNLILNHHILINKQFTISIDKDNIRCDVMRSQNMVNCQDTYYNILYKNGIDISKIKILTALIWINMSPLHLYPLNNFLYYFGKYNLWRELKKMM